MSEDYFKSVTAQGLAALLVLLLSTVPHHSKNISGSSYVIERRDLDE
jgi:hypothetical protein